MVGCCSRWRGGCSKSTCCKLKYLFSKRLAQFNAFSLKRYFANKTYRIQFTTGVFAVLLLIPLTPSINMLGQLGYFNRRVQVETFEGGIIDVVSVKEGDQVEAGQKLMVVSDIRTDSEYEAQLQQLAAKLCRQARFTSMLSLEAFVYPDAPDWVSQSYLSSYCEAERKIAEDQIATFTSRRKSQKNQISEIIKENASLERSVSIEAQRLGLQKDIYGKKKSLHDSGFLSQLALLESNKELMDGEQRLSDKQAELSVRKEKLIELRRQVDQIESDYFDRARNEHNTLLSDIEVQKQRMQYLIHARANFVINAPQSGVIYSIKKNRQGSLLAPRDIVLEIVPNTEDMVAIAVMPAKETSYVAQGQDAIVRLQTHNQSFAPEFKGRIVTVSADIKTDKPNDPPSYQVFVSFGCDAACARKNGLVAGMPVDVYVLGAKRSLLSYLLDAVLKGSRKVLSEPS